MVRVRVLPHARYNGETYDARMETPGWTTAAFKPDPAVPWAPVTLARQHKL